MLDLTKPVQTRDGNPARIIATDVKGANERIVALVDIGTEELLSIRSSDGRCSVGMDSPGDLVNVPRRQTLYVNAGDSYSNPAFAKNNVNADWPVLAIEVECEDDELKNITRVVSAERVLDA